MKRAVISCSGGLDSTALLINLLTDGYLVNVVNFQYGQKHAIESRRLEDCLHYLNKFDFRIEYSEYDLKAIFKDFKSNLLKGQGDIPEGHYAGENMKATVVPNRNAIFASLIYGLALSKAKQTGDDVKIALGVHAGDHEIYPDCRPQFIDAIYNAFKLGNWDGQMVQVYTPYLSYNKKMIIHNMKVNCDILGIDFLTVAKNTNTCYNPDEYGRACGKCGSCNERLEGFKELGIKDPVDYQKGE